MAHPQTDTDEDLAFRFKWEATNATKHRRCGPKSNCRRRALDEVDYVLDVWLERHPVTVAVPDVSAVAPSAITR